MEIKAVSRGTRIAYIYPAGGGKAEEADEGAQQAEVRGKHASTVNAAVVQRKLVFLSGEACGICVPATESGGGSNAGVTPADPKGGWPERTAMERSAMATQQRP